MLSLHRVCRAEVQEKNLSDMQARIVLTELQTPLEGLLLKSSSFTDPLSCLFSLRWPEHAVTQSRGRNEPYMDIAFCSDRTCSAVLSAPLCGR